jgi:hypothetical protein
LLISATGDLQPTDLIPYNFQIVATIPLVGTSAIVSVSSDEVVDAKTFQPLEYRLYVARESSSGAGQIYSGSFDPSFNILRSMYASSTLRTDSIYVDRFDEFDSESLFFTLKLSVNNASINHIVGQSVFRQYVDWSGEESMVHFLVFFPFESQFH